jgi:uncharacterized surface protein with fasciclin (FAS1) repeats
MELSFPPPAATPPAGGGGTTITDLAMMDPDLTSLVEVLVALGLADDLAGPGPFTVFAPTNAAFAEIAGDTAMMDTATLTRVVLYHVIAGEAIPRNGFVTGSEYPLNFVPLSVASVPMPGSSNNLVYLSASGARIVGSSIVASNGIIHKVNAVMIPPAPPVLPVLGAPPLLGGGDDDDDDDDDADAGDDDDDDAGDDDDDDDDAGDDDDDDDDERRTRHRQLRA